MKLTPKEQDRLTIFTLAELARRRKARGIKLNHPEAVALITDEVMEEARAGRTYDEVVAHGMQLLSEDDVMEGVAELAKALYVISRNDRLLQSKQSKRKMDPIILLRFDR